MQIKESKSWRISNWKLPRKAKTKRMKKEGVMGREMIKRDKDREIRWGREGGQEKERRSEQLGKVVQGCRKSTSN